jgi:hypothetical protein
LISANRGQGIKWWYVRDSTLKNSNSSDNHHDLWDGTAGTPPPHLGGWFVIQDTDWKNTQVNAFMVNGWGTGTGVYMHVNQQCTDPTGPGGIVFQNSAVGNIDPGYSGNAQLTLNPNGNADIPELWLIDVTLGGGLGWDLRCPVSCINKVVVIGGSGSNTAGWPGPLRPRRSHDTITSETCPGGWDGTKCCPNGRVNTGVGEGLSHNTTYDDAGIIPIYCYDSIDSALNDGHSEPPFVRNSTAGWADCSSIPCSPDPNNPTPPSVFSVSLSCPCDDSPCQETTSATCTATPSNESDPNNVTYDYDCDDDAVYEGADSGTEHQCTGLTAGSRPIAVRATDSNDPNNPVTDTDVVTVVGNPPSPTVDRFVFSRNDQSDPNCPGSIYASEIVWEPFDTADGRIVVLDQTVCDCFAVKVDLGNEGTSVRFSHAAPDSTISYGENNTPYVYEGDAGGTNWNCTTAMNTAGTHTLSAWACSADVDYDGDDNIHGKTCTDVVGAIEGNETTVTWTVVSTAEHHRGTDFQGIIISEAPHVP